MAISRRTGRSRFTLLLLVMASLTVLTLDFRDSGPVEGLQGFASTVFSPVRTAASAVTEPFENGWHGIFDYDDVQADNEALRRRIDELEGDRIENRANEEELEALRRLADAPTGGVESTTGRVISGPLSSFDSTIEINRGSGDSVTDGMPVVTEAGLIGQVTSVTGDRSQVQLITDPEFELGIRIIDTQVYGIAHGTGDDGELVVDEGIPLDAEIREGALVNTSGIDRSAFPPNVNVGRVVEVGRTADQTEQRLVIEPVADLGALSYVKVLLWDGG